jgi:pimeloyl-ACP methyl ester carboxylesterase
MQTNKILATLILACVVASVDAQDGLSESQLAPGQQCTFLTQANADASAGEPNVDHDGMPIPGLEAPDISKGFNGIPRSAQPPLTSSQKRILECTYHLPEANADMPYTLFIPSTYDAGTPTPLIVDLHGFSITPLQQILFDGTVDLAERFGFIVVAPMGFSVADSWGARFARDPEAVDTAAMNPASNERYTSAELAELDAMTVVARIRERYAINDDRIYLMGHSMGGMGTYYLGAKYNDIWAALAPVAGLGGIASDEAAERYKSIPVLLMHGDKDSIIPAPVSRRAAMALQNVGAQHVYLEVPGADHEFWIRRGAEHMEKVFLFFELVSRRTNVGFITPEMAPEVQLGPPPPAVRP